jgi:hypothetical protein
MSQVLTSPVVVLRACSVATSHCRWPLLWSSRAFCDAVTTDVTLPIFVHPRTFVRLGTFVKLPFVQGRSLDFCPLDLHRSRVVRPWTFVRWTCGLPSYGLCPAFCHLVSYVLPSCHFVRHPFVTIHSHWCIIFFKPYVVLELCNYFSILLQSFGAWDNTMSLDDESTTVQPKPRY